MLLAGYESSDDESAPVAGPSVSRVDAVDDDENDEEIAEQVETDAFGLATVGPQKAVQINDKLAVAAAPDVLKEDPNTMSNAIITRATDQVR